jgi:hypothetical protein
MKPSVGGNAPIARGHLTGHSSDTHVQTVADALNAYNPKL